MRKLADGKALTEAQRLQRVAAGKASGAARHKTKTKPTVTVLIGSPASGKTTWHQAHRPQARLISTDAILQREGLPTTPDTIDHATKIARREFREAAAAGHDIVLDRTNPTVKSRGRWLALLPPGYHKEAVVFDTHGLERAWRVRQRELAGKGVNDPRLRAIVPIEAPIAGEFDHVETVTQGVSQGAIAWARRTRAAKVLADARHKGETSPSIRQGAGAPASKEAVGLFRQGQARPGAGGARSVWDTRGTEAPIGAMNATFTFHFPDAYRSATPDRPRLGRKQVAQALARAKAGGPHQDVVITNPQTLLEAQRHPVMRELATAVINVVREHQDGAIEKGHERNLIPAGTRPGTVVRAYKHAALRALHKVGLGDYDTRMDAAAKAEFTPLVPFMRYVHRRIFDHLNQQVLKGKWGPFRTQFGQLHRQRKHGKLTGHERMRMRPVEQFIKLHLTDGQEVKLHLTDGDLEKAWASMDAPDQGLRKRWTRFSQQDGFASTPPHSGIAGHQDIASQALMHHAVGKPIPEPPGGVPPIAGAGRIKHKAIEVEAHFSVPRIGGSTVKESNGLYRVVPLGELVKLDLPMSLFAPSNEAAKSDVAKSDMGFTLGSYNVDPTRQLNRAIHPRIRRRLPRLRLNTQRHLRHVLNGGVTRQERWQLFGKLAKRQLTEREVHAAARSVQIPTLGQREAGNYQKGHLSVGGLGITIETPKGRVRRGQGPDGKPWQVTMPAHYGYVKRSLGADGDHVDAYLGPHAHEAAEYPVFVVDQHDAKSGRFDEHKCLLGFRDRQHVTSTYDAGFSDGHGPRRRKAVHQMTFADFKQWVGHGDTTTPLKKGLGGAALGVGRTAAGAFGRSSTRTKLAAGVAAGATGAVAAPKVKQVLADHPAARGIAGAAVAGGAAALLTRGHAMGLVRGASRKLYQTGLKNAVREHARHLAGATPSPHVRAAARQVFLAAKTRALHDAQTARRAGMSRLRVHPKKVAVGALAGGAVAAAAGPRHIAPPLYQLAAQPEE